MNKKLVCWLSMFAMVLGAQGFVPVAAGTWTNVTGNLANMASECGNLTMVSPVPGSDTIIAGVALQGLWANTSGSAWTHLGVGAGSDTIINRPSWIVYDPAHAGVFWESGIYNGGGVYKTTDHGSTFHQLGPTATIRHMDYVSVDFSDPNRQTLVAGGHEQSQAVWRSANGGQDWTNIGLNLPANTGFSTNPLIVDSQTYLANTQTSWGGGSPGIYRTTNGGASWQQVSALGPSGPPLVAANGTIYWPVENGTFLKSTNSGLSWTQAGSNLRSVRAVELPDGTLIAVGGNTLVTSADGGSTWTPIGPTLPFTPVSLIYSPNRQAFFITHFDCGGVVLPDAIMRLDYATSPPPIPAAPANLRILR